MQEVDDKSMVEELYQESCDRLHFRFFCTSPEAETILNKSINRTWLELAECFPDAPIDIDVSNNVILNLYPFLQNKNNNLNLVVSGFSPKLWTDGRFICGVQTPKFKNEIPDSLIKSLYNEQFYFRLTVLLYDRKEMDTVNSIIVNLIQNSDIPNVILSSIESECKKGSTPLDLGKYLPSIDYQYKYQPIAEVAKLSAPMKIGSDSLESNSFADWDEASIRTEVPVMLLSEPCSENESFSIAKESDFIERESVYIEINSTIAWHQGPQHVAALFEEEDGRCFPIWEVGDLERGLTLTRRVSVPAVESLESLFKIAREYPISAFFGDSFPSNYMIMLSLSKIPYIPNIFDEGMVLCNDYDIYGKEFFNVFYPNSEEEEEGETLVFRGSEAHLIEFLYGLISVHENEGVVGFDDAYRLSLNLGTLPDEDDKLAVNYN